MKKLLLIITVALVTIIVPQSLYILDQTEQSVVLRFGEAVDFEDKPGLKYKLPFVDDVIFFDNRILDLNADPKEVISSDQKRLIVDAFAKYKIIDPLKFVQTVKSERMARSKLNSILESSIRQVLGEEQLNVVLQEGKREAVMSKIQSNVNTEALSFGIEVVDVRIMRADLPAKNSQAIFYRMQSEREKEAREFRAEGSEEAQKITAKAERDKLITVANAKRDADIIKGQADAKASNIFAKAYGKDIDFYEFYKSMESYKNSIANNNTNLYLSPNSEFFKYFGNLNQDNR
ncbi:MAG: protease modulator HflC [Rickettsiales bacterium]|jgi:modulator of FtsH protease HflC|nr:protease modulator HflC [Rickettsiales bacterium]